MLKRYIKNSQLHKAMCYDFLLCESKMQNESKMKGMCYDRIVGKRKLISLTQVKHFFHFLVNF